MSFGAFALGARTLASLGASGSISRRERRLRGPKRSGRGRPSWRVTPEVEDIVKVRARSAKCRQCPCVLTRPFPADKFEDAPLRTSSGPRRQTRSPAGRPSSWNTHSARTPRSAVQRASSRSSRGEPTWPPMSPRSESYERRCLLSSRSARQESGPVHHR